MSSPTTTQHDGISEHKLPMDDASAAPQLSSNQNQRDSHKSRGVLRMEAVARAGKTKAGKQSLYLAGTLIMLMVRLFSSLPSAEARARLTVPFAPPSLFVDLRRVRSVPSITVEIFSVPFRFEGLTLYLSRPSRSQHDAIVHHVEL